MGLIECREICKSFGEKVALDHVSIDVPQGSIFGLLGPNGAGKTTLIRIINRITIPGGGEVLFDGRPITQRDVERIGYLPEERGLYRKMEVGDQAMYLARLKGMTSAELAEKVGLSHDFIRQIESEKTRYNFSVETFYKISLALGVSMDVLAEDHMYEQ